MPLLRLPLAPTLGLLAFTPPITTGLRRIVRSPFIHMRPDGAGRLVLHELRGDAVEVVFAELVDADLVRDALTPLEGLRDLQVSGEVLHVRAPHGASAVPGILSTLESSSLRVASVKISRPSLDDVYLQHTGRTFQEAEQQSAT